MRRDDTPLVALQLIFGAVLVLGCFAASLSTSGTLARIGYAGAGIVLAVLIVRNIADQQNDDTDEWR